MTTETMKHTPGPWTLERRPAYGATGTPPVPKRIISDYGTICSFNEGRAAVTTEEREANAALFMASRDLLAALIDAVGMLEVYTDPRGRVYESTAGQARSTIRDARAAIAKAEGR